MALQSYKELEVWQRGISLVNEVYDLTKKLPKSERYGLSSQMQRAAVSIPSNIAEGYSRNGTAEYVQFLSIAYGSSAELETQLIIMNHQYPNISNGLAIDLLTEVQKMLFSIIKQLRKTHP